MTLVETFYLSPKGGYTKLASANFDKKKVYSSIYETNLYLKIILKRSFSPPKAIGSRNRKKSNQGQCRA